MTKHQELYLNAIEARDGDKHWVTIDDIRLGLPRAKRSVSDSSMHVTLQRIARKLEKNKDEDRLVSDSRGYRLVIADWEVTRSEQIRQIESDGLSRREQAVVDAIVSLNGVGGPWVQRRKIEGIVDGSVVHTLRMLEFRLNEVGHPMRLERRAGMGYRLWPRGDNRFDHLKR